jgi:hypothetical protein
MNCLIAYVHVEGTTAATGVSSTQGTFTQQAAISGTGVRTEIWTLMGGPWTTIEPVTVTFGSAIRARIEVVGYANVASLGSSMTAQGNGTSPNTGIIAGSSTVPQAAVGCIAIGAGWTGYKLANEVSQPPIWENGGNQFGTVDGVYLLTSAGALGRLLAAPSAGNTNWGLGIGISAAANYAGCMLMLNGTSDGTTDDLSYMYTATGVELNPPNSATPYFDVSSVTGHDLPDMNVNSDNMDGGHGGFVDATYVGPRTWIISGTAYGDPTNGIDSFLETLRTNFLPRATTAPFYFKLPGLAQRISHCKPISFKFDYDQARRIGSADVQIQLEASDARCYSSSRSLFGYGGNNVSVNVGNISSFPKVRFMVDPGSTTTAITLSAISASFGTIFTVGISTVGLPVGGYEYNFATQRLTNIVDPLTQPGVASTDYSGNIQSIVVPAGYDGGIPPNNAIITVSAVRNGGEAAPFEWVTTDAWL